MREQQLGYSGQTTIYSSTIPSATFRTSDAEGEVDGGVGFPYNGRASAAGGTVARLKLPGSDEVDRFKVAWGL